MPAIILLLSACAENDPARVEAESGGTLIISTTADPGSLFPPHVSTWQGRQITEQIYDHLADVGPEMSTRGDANFRQQLADGWRWSEDSLSIAFHLHPRAKWHDGRSVTARDVRFTFALYTNPVVGASTRSDLAQIDSVTASDSSTAVFWFRRGYPTQFLDAAAQMLVLPAHLLERIPPDSLRERVPPPIGSGRFRLRSWDKGSRVELIADTGNHRGRARLDRVIWTIAPEFTAAVTKLFTKNADLFELLRPENIQELSRHPDLRIVTLPGLDYVFLQFNLRDPVLRARPHPLFGSRDLRRAVALAIDRELLVRSLFDTLAVVPSGPTVRAYPTTDASLRQLPFDSARASAVLDSVGWLRPGGSATRIRDGRELAFSVLVPSSSATRVRMAVLLQEQLRRAGIRMSIEQLDYPAFMSKWGSREFDAALGTWNMGSTPGATAYSWATSGIGRGTNFGSYSNPVFDAQLDSALSARDPETAKARFTRAYTTINEDAPAVWLYEPKTVIGLHRRIRTTPMRPGGWWTDLASWWIPAADRLPRDKTPVSR